MKTTTFNIYQDTNGNLSLKEYTETYENQNWAQYLSETGQTERLKRLNAMRSRERNPKVRRIRMSETFKQWQVGKDITITTHLYGTASASYDGRIPEHSIQYAILQALRYNEKEAHYYPRSNDRKPAHEHLVYVFSYDFKKA